MIRYTLLADGASDKALMQIINWTINDQWPEAETKGQFADLWHIKPRPAGLRERAAKAVEYYPCDILFVHRDAEQIRNNEAIFGERKSEIAAAVKTLYHNCIPVIPIKMTETWLLTNVAAIRKASGSRNQSLHIPLPPVNKLEVENNPKEKLYELLKSASGLKGRRLASFNERHAVHLVAEYTSDFSPLKSLFAFQQFEKDLAAVLSTLK